MGRLDKDSEGLLLLTNDGELAHRLLSPKRHVDKVYRIRVDRPLGEADRAPRGGQQFVQTLHILRPPLSLPPV